MTTRATQIGKKVETLRLKEEGDEEEEVEPLATTGNSSWVNPILGPRRLEKTPIIKATIFYQ
jgi:hypothetical protein